MSLRDLQERRACWIYLKGGNSWFFKLMGPDVPVASLKAGFVEFLHTVKEAK